MNPSTPPPREAVCSYCPTCKALRDGQVHESVADTPRGHEIRHYGIIASPLKDKAGRIIAAIEMVTDITESVRTQQQLLESQIRYRTVFETGFILSLNPWNSSKGRLHFDSSFTPFFQFHVSFPPISFERSGRAS
ncbi:MAG: hypothetical protein CVU53_02760 [Deltaproteobacteria bacterium HGW-Deltaproteobacteria-11]|nr:MAG: hypothetical protein CVU53_02760 [Deltaproteobacteria bacterium HGW-Deltaproteobacteria-11]